MATQPKGGNSFFILIKVIFEPDKQVTFKTKNKHFPHRKSYKLSMLI